MTGNKQLRNDQMESLLAGSFVTRKEYMSDGARLLSAVLATHRAWDGSQGAGGTLLWGFMGDSTQNFGRSATTLWTLANISNACFHATPYGGPFVTLNSGSAQVLYVPDVAYREPGTTPFLVWHWCKMDSLAADEAVVSMYETQANNCSFRLWLDSGTPALSWTCNATGNVINDVTLPSSYAPATDTWYFVAGYFYASMLMRIYVGAATDVALTVDSLAVGVPAGIFDGLAFVTLGCSWIATNPQYFSGDIGVGHGRVNVPAGTAAAYPEIDGHVSRLFHLTRWFYQE